MMRLKKRMQFRLPRLRKLDATTPDPKRLGAITQENRAKRAMGAWGLGPMRNKKQSLLVLEYQRDKRIEEMVLERRKEKAF